MYLFQIHTNMEIQRTGIECSMQIPVPVSPLLFIWPCVKTTQTETTLDCSPLNLHQFTLNRSPTLLLITAFFLRKQNLRLQSWKCSFFHESLDDSDPFAVTLWAQPPLGGPIMVDRAIAPGPAPPWTYLFHYFTPIIHRRITRLLLLAISLLSLTNLGRRFPGVPGPASRQIHHY